MHIIQVFEDYNVDLSNQIGRKLNDDQFFTHIHHRHLIMLQMWKATCLKTPIRTTIMMKVKQIKARKNTPGEHSYRYNAFTIS